MCDKNALASISTKSVSEMRITSDAHGIWL